MTDERPTSPLQALLVQQRWQVLEAASLLAARQRSALELEQRKLSLVSQQAAFAAELERQCQLGKELNPALLDWLAAHHVRHVQAASQLEERLATERDAVKAGIEKLAKERTYERHLEDALKNLLRDALDASLAKESQIVSDQWGSRRAGGNNG
jgi:hypothetical protein